jgi:hypothetical protein
MDPFLPSSSSTALTATVFDLMSHYAIPLTKGEPAKPHARHQREHLRAQLAPPGDEVRRFFAITRSRAFTLPCWLRLTPGVMVRTQGLADSGAEINLVTKALAERLGAIIVPLSSTRFRVTDAQNKPLRILGRLSMPIDAGLRACTGEFVFFGFDDVYVVDADLPYPIIFGLPFLGGSNNFTLQCGQLLLEANGLQFGDACAAYRAHTGLAYPVEEMVIPAFSVTAVPIRSDLESSSKYLRIFDPILALENGSEPITTGSGFVDDDYPSIFVENSSAISHILPASFCLGELQAVQPNPSRVSALTFQSATEEEPPPDTVDAPDSAEIKWMPGVDIHPDEPFPPLDENSIARAVRFVPDHLKPMYIDYIRLMTGVFTNDFSGPAWSMGQHHIDLLPGAAPYRSKPIRMNADHTIALKAVLDKWLTTRTAASPSSCSPSPVAGTRPSRPSSVLLPSTACPWVSSTVQLHVRHGVDGA